MFEKITLFFLLFTSLFPPFSQFQKMGGTWEELGRYLGGTWEERFRFTFVTSLLSNRYQSEVLSKTKRSSIEDLSNIYRRPIEDLSKTYRRPIEHLSKRSWVRFLILSPYGLSVMPKKGVPIFILTHPLFITFFIGNKSQCG